MLLNKGKARNVLFLTESLAHETGQLINPTVFCENTEKSDEHATICLKLWSRRNTLITFRSNPHLSYFMDTGGTDPPTPNGALKQKKIPGIFRDVNWRSQPCIGDAKVRSVLKELLFYKFSPDCLGRLCSECFTRATILDNSIKGVQYRINLW